MVIANRVRGRYGSRLWAEKVGGLVDMNEWGARNDVHDPTFARSPADIFRKVPDSLLMEFDEEISDTGLNASDRKEVAAHLYKAIADSHVLELKCRRYYWNVKGPSSHLLKSMLLDQANRQSQLIEGIGQRIRAHSFEVPCSLLEFLELSEIRERGVPVHGVEMMLKDLAAGHELMVRNLKAAIPLLEVSGDLPSLEVFTRHIAFHEDATRQLLSCLQYDRLSLRDSPS